MSDKKELTMILDKISEVSERTARMEVQQQNMKEDIEGIKEQDKVQNQLLAEHIAGVQTAHERLNNEIQIRKSIEEQQKNLKSRVETLEEGPKFLKTLKTIVLYIAAVGGAVLAILKWFPN